MTGTTTAKNSGAPLPVLREIPGGKLKRDLSFVSGTIDQEARTVVFSASSEYPVARWFGMEVLDHAEASVDLTRMRNGAPYLLQHNAWSGQIGVVLEAWLEERRLHVKVKLSRNDEAEKIWRDLVDNIRQNVSIGYIPLEMTLERTEGNQEFYRVTRWEPFEVSSVSVPADPTVGLGRSHEATTNTIIVRGKSMTGTTQNPAVDPAAPETRAQPHVTFGTDALAAERQRSADVLAIGQRFNQPELAQEAVAKGYSPDQLRGLILERQAPSAPLNPLNPQKDARELPGFLTDVSSRAIGLTEKEVGQYSLMRAINAAADNDWSKAGFERQVSLALADATKKEARGFYVPHDLLVRGMSKGEAGKGGALVANELRLDEFVDILRNKTVLAKMGMRMLGGLVGDLDLPKKISGSNFTWLGEGQDASLSDFDLTTLPMSPKTIAGGIPVTRKLRKQASRSIESLIIDDLVEGLGVAIDLGGLLGSGVGNHLLGLLNQGLPLIEFDGPGLTYGKAVDMRTKVASFNAATGALGYLTSVTQAGLAQQTERFANTGRTIWEDGKVNGYRAEDTNQMPDDTWLFGDFSQMVMGLWGVLDLKIDTSTLAASDGLVIRVFQDVDATVRGKSSFCLGKKKAA